MIQHQLHITATKPPKYLAEYHDMASVEFYGIHHLVSPAYISKMYPARLLIN